MMAKKQGPLNSPGKITTMDPVKYAPVSNVGAIQVALYILILPLASPWSVSKTSDTYSYSIIRNTSAPIFREVAEEFWRWRLRQSPEFATTLGIHDYDDKLETFTEEAFAHRKERCEQFLEELAQVDPTTLSDSEKNNLLFLREDLRTYVQGYRWSRFSTLNPINSLEGLHKDYSYWLDAMRFSDEEDFMKYIQRLRAVATQINEQISLMRQAIRIGWTNHKIAVEPVISTLNDMETRASRTAFYRPFNESILGLGFSTNKVEKLRLHGEAVIIDHVLPAYKNLKQFMTQEYLPNTRPDIGISSLPGGYDFYRAVARWHLSVDFRPEELHEIGRRLVETLRDRIDTIRHRVGYLGSLETFMRYTQRTPKFFHVSQEHLLKGYKDIVYKQIKPRLKQIFKDINLMDLQIWQMPFDGPPGVAMPPADDGSMPGVFFVNVRRPHKIPKWKMMSLSLHEALPGHHLQTCYALNASIPTYRRKREFRKMFAVPFQFPFQAAYTEGWAVYAETLGREMRLFTDHFDEYGRLLSDLINTARLVTDTGIHVIGWSRERAVRYFSSKTGESRAKAEEEVDRFITIPGQALQYKMGHLKFEQLRYKSQRLLGDRFNLKEFHHQVLQLGPVSLKTLEHVINTWIYSLAPDAAGCNGLMVPITTCLVTAITCLYVSGRRVFQFSPGR